MNGIAQKYTCSFWRSKMKPHVAGSQRGARRKRPPMFLSKRRLPATQGEEQTAEDTPQPRIRVNYLGIFCRLGLPALVCMFAIQALLYGVSLFVLVASVGVAGNFVLTCIIFAYAYACEPEEMRKIYYIIGILSTIFTIIGIISVFILR